MDALPEGRRIFLAYCHADEPWKQRLCRELAGIPGVEVEAWNETRLAFGEDLLRELSNAATRCSLAVLLLSDDFEALSEEGAASEFAIAIETKATLRRTLHSIPGIAVLVRPVSWERTSWLSDMQVYAHDRSLSEMSADEATVTLAELASHVAEVLAGHRRPGAIKRQPRTKTLHGGDRRPSADRAAPLPSPEEALTLAFRLVLAGIAAPDLLRQLKPELLRDGLKHLEARRLSPGRGETPRQWLEETYPDKPNPLWLAWAATVRPAEVAALQREAAQ